tara:strand:+ start:1263 stop:1382 length:120 start_codon:yes stop_codon:yes gene_type:complete
MIRWDDLMGKYTIIVDGMLVGTFTTVQAAEKHLRLINTN